MCVRVCRAVRQQPELARALLCYRRLLPSSYGAGELSISGTDGDCLNVMCLAGAGGRDRPQPKATMRGTYIALQRLHMHERHKDDMPKIYRDFIMVLLGSSLEDGPVFYH